MQKISNMQIDIIYGTLLSLKYIGKQSYKLDRPLYKLQDCLSVLFSTIRVFLSYLNPNWASFKESLALEHRSDLDDSSTFACLSLQFNQKRVFGQFYQFFQKRRDFISSINAIAGIQINQLSKKMRFTIPNAIPSVNSDNHSQQQGTNPNDSYILRGSQPTFQEFLQQIQNNLLQHQIIDQDTVVMVSFNQGEGQIVLGFLKSNEPNKRISITPDIALMEEAISQHQQKQSELISFLKTGIEKVKFNRKAYQKSMQLIQSNSLPQLSLQTLKKGLQLDKQPSQVDENELIAEKPRSLSEDTLDQPDQFQKEETKDFLQRQQKRSESGESLSSRGEMQSIY